MIPRLDWQALGNRGFRSNQRDHGDRAAWLAWFAEVRQRSALAVAATAPHFDKLKAGPRLSDEPRDAKVMGDFQYFDIILFAMIAGFLVLRLRSVLGRRTGNERRREGYIRAPAPVSEKAGMGAESGKEATVVPLAAKPVDAVALGLDRIRRADPSFDPERFMAGARAAFEIIVGAFANGDKAALRPLLSDEVYRPFVATIDERAAAGETLETRILRLDGLDIAAAELVGQNARITVRFVSEQVNLTRATDGSIVDGDPEHSVEKTDFWTFARDSRSTDPNWVLAATGSA
jgi:predicted lipid-binding transport protein (Tim44 family)